MASAGDALLQARIRDQEAIIRNLSDEYARATGREFEIGQLVGPEGRYASYGAAQAEAVLERPLNFMEKAKVFGFVANRVQSRALAQAQTAELLHTKRPTTASRPMFVLTPS